jgi:hypothetical protein
MSEQFLRILFPGQASVCGRVLPQLTLWRLACLFAIQSPFLSIDKQGGVFTLSDLLLAVRAVKARNQCTPSLRPSCRDLITLLFRRKNKAYREKHGACFVEWLSLHQLSPELWENEDSDNRTISAPFILSQVAGLMGLGMTHAEAWDTPPGYAKWLLAAHAERQTDRVKFYNDEDDEINMATAALDERTEAETLAQAKTDLSPEAYERWLSARQTLKQG